MTYSYKATFQDLRDALDVAQLMSTTTPDNAERDTLGDMLKAFTGLFALLADAISDVEYELAKDSGTLDMFDGEEAR